MLTKLFFICAVMVVGCLILFAVIYPRLSSTDSQAPPDDLRSVRTLPYAGWIPESENTETQYGVTKHDPEKAFPGVNIYTSTNMSGARFYNMQGDVIHELIDKRETPSGWKLVEPYFDDGFLILIDDQALFKIDWESNVAWENKKRFHHDMSVAPDGTIYSVVNEKIMFHPFTTEQAILDNVLVILSADGRVTNSISFATMVAREPALLEAAKSEQVKEYRYQPDAWDVFHTNSIELIDRDVRIDGHQVFAKGNVLFCMRHLDMVGVVDVEKRRIVWYWGLGEVDNPHDPSILENGHLLLFDNGARRGYSKVIEVNPLKSEIISEIAGNADIPFFTSTRGSAKRLPNGNTIIVESEKGRTFELSPDREIVWEFISFPVEHGSKRRDMLYRLPRLLDLDRYPRLRSADESSS